MRSSLKTLLTIPILFNSIFFCKAQSQEYDKNVDSGTTHNIQLNPIYCKDTCSAILLNSTKEKDDWQIVSGPALTGIPYPFQAFYTKPFPSWEMDRYTADSSYFSNCDWMILPDKRKVVNTVTGLPIVFIKRFTTIAPSRLKLIVKMLYDNMAYLYLDSTRITLHHRNPDINRFIRQLQPELSSFVSIAATFNFSYNASFYAGDCYNLVFPKGEHTIKIELYNNANELGCIIKGILASENNEKIFCGPPIKEEQSQRAGILLFRDKKAFPGNKTADTFYDALMQSVKTGYWINSHLKGDQDITGHDTLFIKKGEKINVAPAYVTAYYNDNKDTSYASGSLKKITTLKTAKKPWRKTIVFDALLPGVYLLEINCETPADAQHAVPGVLRHYSRIVKVK